MAQSVSYYGLNSSISLHPQLGDTFLSSKHLDYMAAIAEFSSW